ncbi:MAG TPA: MATE family efflux transporter [Lachnospiraceae bacterium]|nr:MATE family efflux transporter [Lachnospiraceae bacterium]
MLYSNRDLKKLIIPLIVEQVLAIAVGMADTIMVSAAGEAAVSGVSLVDTVNILLINIFSALATGGAVVAGHFLGKKKREDACRTAWQILEFATLLALLISALFIIAHNSLLRLMFGKIEREVMQASRTYLIITAFSFVALAVYNSCAALFRAMNGAKVTMWVSLLMNGINVIGNAVCIYGLHMGVAGVAIPTTVSRYVAAAVIFSLMFRKENEIHLCGQLRLGFDKQLIKKILYIAVPNGLENSMFQMGKILVISAVSTMGTAAIAANAVANTLASWNILPGVAMNLAIVSVVSVCVGAGEYGQARYYTKKLCLLAEAGMVLISVVLFFSVPYIARLYHLGPEAYGMTVEVMRFHAVLAVFLWVCSFSIPNTLRAAGDVVLPMGIAIISMWLFRVVAAYVFTYVFHIGLLGIWVAMIIDWGFRAVCYLLRYRGHKWEMFGNRTE